MVMAGFSQPGAVYQPLPLTWPGPLAVSQGGILIPADANYQILAVRAAIFSPSVGAPVIADVLMNGTTIFTTQANRPTIPAGVNSSTVTVPDVVTVTNGSLLSLSVAQVGSTSPGSGLCVVVSLQRTT